MVDENMHALGIRHTPAASSTTPQKGGPTEERSSFDYSGP